MEPIARERAGRITREKVWREMLDGMPRGLPGPRDGGLDGATAWGPVYREDRSFGDNDSTEGWVYRGAVGR